MSSPPDSPLSSIGSDDGSAPQPGNRTDITATPSRTRRQSDASHDDPSQPSKRRKITQEEDDDTFSQISEDSFASAPGSPSHDEWAVSSDQVTICQWDGCTAGNLGNSDDLIAHVQTEHVGTKRAKYTCDWGDCQRKGQTHPSGYALKAHMRSHTKEKPFFCSLPGMSLSSSRQSFKTKR